jgi:ABC-2 type transport system ATP-binding protein
MEPAIQWRNVTKEIGQKTAVSRIDLALYPGELVGLVGPDGAGKTTLARLAAGVLAPSAGQVTRAGGRVGYLSGRFSLYPELTVWENLAFFARLYGMRRAEIEREGTALLEWVGLLPFQSRQAGALSGGMRQKLALVCAVIHQPPVLILDEPTTAVDPVARAEFWALLKEQAQGGRAILVTTPYFDEAEACHRVALLHEGRILAQGAPDAIRRQLPHQMALLTPTAGQRRGEVLATAERLPGCRWAYPMGVGVRVALDPGPLPAPPAGYALEGLRPTLADLFLWLTREGAIKEVAGR